MNKALFMKLVYRVREYDDYFLTKKDCTGIWGFSSIQKCTAAMRLLAYHPFDQQCPLAQVDHQVPAEFHAFLWMHAEICDEQVHCQLQDDLAEHLWLRKRNH
jgi:hypothetical protein